MRLDLRSRTYDLVSRALVMGVGGRPGDLAAQGADIVEVRLDDVGVPGGAASVPICVVASGEAEVALALAASVALVRLLLPTSVELARCAAAGAAVVVRAGAEDDALAVGLPPERIVIDSLVVDVAGLDDPLAATIAGVLAGGRIVRSDDVRGARRVCDVLAAIMEAR